MYVADNFNEYEIPPVDCEINKAIYKKIVKTLLKMESPRNFERVLLIIMRTLLLSNI